jgi:hypothetical protein
MSPVRRRLVYLIAWAVATVVTVGIAWLGIRSVLVAAAPSKTSPLSAADLREAAPKPVPTLTPSPAPGPTTASPAPPPAAPGGSSPGPVSPDAWTPISDGKGGLAYRRIFRTAGGDAVVLSAKGNVKIESTAPKSGFTVNVSRQSTESVIVSFFGPRKASRVWARWNDGPYAEVTEVAGFTT